MKTIFKKLMVALLFIMMPTANVAAAVSLNYDGNIIQLKNEVILEDGMTLVPMREIFEVLKATIEWDGADKRITATKEDTTVILVVDSTTAYINDEAVTIAVAPRMINGITYVPIRFIADAFDYDVDWRGSDQEVVISSSGNNGFTTISTDNIPVTEDMVLAYEGRYETSMNYDDVYEKVIRKNSTLKQLANSLDLAEKQRDILGASVVYRADSNMHDNAIYQATMLAQLQAMNEYEKVLKSLPLSEQITKDFVKLSIYSSFNSIIEYELNLIILEKQIEYERQALYNMELKHQLGMVSQYEYDKAKLEFDKLLESKSALELTIDAEYMALNSMMGINSDSRYNIDFDMAYEPIGDVDLKTHISRKTDTDLNVKIARATLDAAVFNASVHGLDDTNSTYETKQNAQKDANRKLEDAKTDVDKNVRDTYAKMKQLETQIQSNLIELEKAKADYNTLLTQYSTGNVTELKLQQGSLAVYSAELALQKNKNSHFLLRLMFENPHLTASGQ